MNKFSTSSSASSITALTIYFFLFFIPVLVSSQTCKNSCGDQQIHYPFGSGPGCGDPRLQTYVTCDQQDKLTLTTHTGIYTINTIDYGSQIIYIQDSTMSTCSATQPSKGFGLDWNAPFTFLEDNIFALLDCSTTSSPLFNSNSGVNGSTFPLCANEGAPICTLLYSCPAIYSLNLPISTCCVYTPVDLGPAYEMDLKKLRCSSYASIFSFNGQDSNPASWKFGIALKYKFSVNNDYPSACSVCERSNGVCGYTGTYNAFICNCIGGVNTTTDCYFSASWSSGVRVLPWKQIGTWLTLLLIIWAQL